METRRKLMIEKIRLLSLVVICSVFAAGCLISLPTLSGLDPVSEPTDESFSSQVKEADDSPRFYGDIKPASEIIFWHQYYGGPRREVIEQIVNRFNTENEWGITVVPEYIGGYDDIQEKVTPLLGTMNAPDVVTAYQSQIAEFQLDDGLIDMNLLVNSSKWGFSAAEEASFPRGIFERDIFSVFGDQRLGFPYYRAMEVMYYNMDWLKELGYDHPPETPEQFKEIACKAVKQPFSEASEGDTYGYLYNSDASRVASWTFAFGGDTFDDGWNDFTYDDLNAVNAVEFLSELYESGCLDFSFEAYDDQQFFGEGRVLFTVASTSGIPYYAESVQQNADFEWSVAAIPHTTFDPVQNVYAASLTIPRTTPERELAAWLFIKYLTTAEIQASWVAAANYLPVTYKAGYLLDELFERYPQFYEAYRLLEYSVTEPSVPGYESIRDIVELEVGLLISNSQEPWEGMQELDDTVDLWLQEHIETDQ